MWITKSTKTCPLAKDYKIKEFWKGIDFELPDPIILGAQVLRDYTKRPMDCTNTYPDGQKFGYHRLKMAGDFCPSYQDEKLPFIRNYNIELLRYYRGEGSLLIESLRKVGINGFGKEKVTVHIDSRPQSVCNLTDKYGQFLIFIFTCHYTKQGKMVVDENYLLNEIPSYKELRLKN
jgi:hypothetical protein